MILKFGGFDWDSGNLPKCLNHGVSLAEIEALFAGDVYLVDEKNDGQETRSLACGTVNERWVFCVFVWRGDRIRPVSVRYMHEKEVRRYAEEISRLQNR